MLTARLLNPGSKLATAGWWTSATIPEVFGVQGASEDDLYQALDWLLQRLLLAAQHRRSLMISHHPITDATQEGCEQPSEYRQASRGGPPEPRFQDRKMLTVTK